jgi:hypothetical protein
MTDTTRCTNEELRRIRKESELPSDAIALLGLGLGLDDNLPVRTARCISACVKPCKGTEELTSVTALFGLIMAAVYQGHAA